jgi:phenylalanyl-tRNA synthetase beta chain
MAQEDCSYTAPGRVRLSLQTASYLGTAGKIRPSVLKKFDIDQEVFAFEINIDALLPLVPQETAFESVPRFPAISRDLTIIIESAWNRGYHK